MTRRYTLVLEAPAAEAEGETLRRLRSLLKIAWRCLRLRCLKITPLEGDGK